MSVTFKCNKTGNTVTFKSQYDIESMRQHPEYTEVQSTNEVLPEKEQVFSVEEQQSKRVGRPKKELV
jgi:hypothetical protein